MLVHNGINNIFSKIINKEELKSNDSFIFESKMNDKFRLYQDEKRLFEEFLNIFQGIHLI